MKRYSYLVLLVALVCLATACSNKKEKTREERIEEFRSELTSEDTTAMLRIADEAMEQLKDKKIDQVIASLFEYNDSTEEVKPISESLAKRYARKFKMFPVLDYKREYFSFMLEGCNDVKYEVTFATAEQAGTAEAPKTKFMFNPVRVDGEWKLCVKTAGDEFDREMN
ncbi:MAG: hypothetical protein II812_06755 [Prevotella sp.]|jgi:hypothetical protein|nr:hypothetical protein [Prevotella sp.]